MNPEIDKILMSLMILDSLSENVDALDTHSWPRHDAVKVIEKDLMESLGREYRKHFMDKLPEKE